MIFEIITNYGKANTQAIQLGKDLLEYEPIDNEKIIFNFQKYGECNPFSNLLLISAIRRFRRLHSNIDTSLIPKENNENGYLSHICFYKTCGIEYGKGPGEARSSENYVPITKIDLQNGDFYENVENISRKLSATLRFDIALSKLITYVFVETIRNVYEHANTQYVIVAAQKWPTLNLVEIAISDDGCGIKESLGHLYTGTEEELIRKSCEPGITARSNFGFVERNDPWRNSGYGLYALKQLPLKYDGSFIICSGNTAIRYFIYNKRICEKVIEADHQGTIIGLRFRTDTNNDFRRILDEIITEGEKQSKNTYGAIITASMSSSGRYHK